MFWLFINGKKKIDVLKVIKVIVVFRIFKFKIEFIELDRRTRLECCV